MIDCSGWWRVGEGGIWWIWWKGEENGTGGSLGGDCVREDYTIMSSLYEGITKRKNRLPRERRRILTASEMKERTDWPISFFP